MSAWVKLRELCVKDGIQTGPFGSQLHQSDYSPIGTPVIMPKDITDRGVSEDGVARVEERHVQRLARHKVCVNDIVYPRRGDVGKSALITEKESGWLCGTGCLKVTIDDKIADAKYVHYYLSQNDVVSWLEKHSVGTTMMNINANILGDIPIDLPPLPTQRRIASLLSDYDSAIANCRRQIALLEEAARRLYREWFAEGKGEKKVIEEMCDTIGGGTPSTGNPEYWNGDVPWVVPTDITKNSCLTLLSTEKKITKLGLAKSSAKMLPPKAILMTSRASVGYFGIADFPVCTNQGFISIVPHEENMRWYLLFNLMARVEEIRAKAKGATFAEISKSSFRAMIVTVPDQVKLVSFGENVSMMMEQELALSRQIRALTEARDRLLPKLMSGEVAV